MRENETNVWKEKKEKRKETKEKIRIVEKHKNKDVVKTRLKKKVKINKVENVCEIMIE